jgi:energy-coupling factor transporter ATP-binding protein EcfA2
MAKCNGCGLEVGSVELENEHNIRRSIVMALRANVAPDKGVNRYFVGRHALIKKIIREHIEGIKDLSTGSMVYLLGQYGSGKTTTLKMLRETSSELSGSFVYSSVNVKEFSRLGDNLYLYREIIKNITLPDGTRGISKFLDRVVSSYPSKTQLRSELNNRNIDNRVASLILHYSDNSDLKKNVVIEWLSGNPEIQAVDLHLIGKKGFQRIRDEEIDVYLAGLNELSKMIGARGLFITIDEAVDPKAQLKDYEIDAIWQNLKYYYNNLYSEPKFPGMVIAIGGTLDLWYGKNLIDKDEAFRQRLNSAVKEELNPLTFNDYVELYQKLIDIWDCVFGKDIKNRVTKNDLEKWTRIIESAGGGFKQITVRQALGELPRPDTSFLRKLDYLVDMPSELGRNVFQ